MSVELEMMNEENGRLRRHIKTLEGHIKHIGNDALRAENEALKAEVTRRRETADAATFAVNALKTEIAELRATVARQEEGSERLGLKGIEMRGEIDALKFTIGSLEGNLTSLEDKDREIEALRVDAGRYRWLRDMDESSTLSLAAIFTDCNGSAQSISMRIDAGVDARMKADAENQARWKAMTDKMEKPHAN